MNKKFLSLVLALVMVLGTFMPSFAAEETEKVEKVIGKSNKVQYLIDKKFVEGNEKGEYELDKNISRAEITKLLVYANGNKATAEKLQGVKIYKDVEGSHWASGVIAAGSTVKSDANGQMMLVGYPNGTFQPEKDVTYAEIAKMLVVLVDKNLTADMVRSANANWPAQWVKMAVDLGILDDVTVADYNAAAVREDVFTMVYNALYKMVEFKRTPANDKIGVLSSLSRDGKLVLNQDEKEQTYQITDETVFVRAYEGNRTNIVKVKNINNPDYYYGSLVRIIFNDKKEVTHIVELGNPSVGAIGTKWDGVADKTISTEMYQDLNSLKDLNRGNVHYTSYVTFNSSKNQDKITSVNFYSANTTESVKNVTLSINDKTKVYVANPANNIMKEVKDINEALLLIGFKAFTGEVKVPNVYAGYNTTDGFRPVLESTVINGKLTAKVIVFNVVAKEAKAQLYRVVSDTASNGITVLEDTDGKLVEKDNFKLTTKFPYNYGDLYDVVKVRFGSVTVADVLETVLDHSNTDKFPILRVVETYADKNIVKVEDRHKDTTVLNLSDADIFNAKEFKDLRSGSVIQIATTKKSNTVDIVSILPSNTELKGTLEGNVNSTIQANTVVARVINVIVSGNDSRLEIRDARDYANEGAGYGWRSVRVNERDAKLLENFIGQYIVFNVDKLYDLDVRGSFFRLNDGKGVDGTGTPLEELVEPELSNIEKLASMIEETRKYTEENLNKENVAEARAFLQAIWDLRDKTMTLTELGEWNSSAQYKAHRDQLANFRKLVEKVEGATR